LPGLRYAVDRFRPMERGPAHPDHAFVVHHSIGRDRAAASSRRRSRDPPRRSCQ
jgi:hypothetical protein